jgi:hypothetical protein
LTNINGVGFLFFQMDSKPRKTMVSFSVEPEELERLRREAEREDRTLSSYIRAKLKRRRTKPQEAAA